MGVDAEDSQMMGAPSTYAIVKFVVRGYWFDGACDLLCLS